MTTVKPNGVCQIVINTMQDQQQQNSIDDEIQHDNEAPHVQCTARSKRSAVEDKDGRSRNCQMDDIMLKCKLHG